MKLFFQTIVSWMFVITKTFHRKSHFFSLVSFSLTFFSWLKASSKISQRNSLYACFAFLRFLLNKFSKSFSNSLLISTKLSISQLSTSNFLIVPWVAFVFSRFRKKMFHFSPSLYLWHLHFTLIPSAILLKSLQVDFYS